MSGDNRSKQPVGVVEPTAASFEDTILFRFPALVGIAGFAHAVTSRPWNMATHCGPDVDLAVQRREKVCRHLGIAFENLTAAEQIHSPHVLPIRASDVGAGREGRHTALRFVDGMVCDLPCVALMQFSADCPIVIAVDPGRQVFGTAHASWRGTVAGITTELVRVLQEELDVDPAELIAAICPCAGPADYAVGDDVRRIALTRLPSGERFFVRDADKWLFDMPGANVDQLVRAGVRAENISVASISTLQDERFFSHRREGTAAGRFALIAGFTTR